MAADRVDRRGYEKATRAVEKAVDGNRQDGNAGSGWSTWTYSNPTDQPAIPGDRGDILANNFVAGGQVGCDYQSGGVVLGVQG